MSAARVNAEFWRLSLVGLVRRKEIRELDAQRFCKAPDGREPHVGTPLFEGRQARLWDVDELRQVGLRKSGRFACLPQSRTE